MTILKCIDGLKRLIQGFLACVMVVSLLPVQIFAVREASTVAVLESIPRAGYQYVLVSGNSAGTHTALNGTDAAGTTVTVQEANNEYAAPYIEDFDDSVIWQVGSGLTFQNIGSEGYLYHDNYNGLKLSYTTAAKWTYNADKDRLEYKNAASRTCYLQYKSGKWALYNSNASECIYAYRVQVRTPKLVPDTLVLDYGLDAVIDVTGNDISRGSVSGISLSDRPYADDGIAIHTGLSQTGRFGDTDLSTEDGFTVSIEAGGIRLRQSGMCFSEPFTFYYESPVWYDADGEAATGYMYSSVTVFPATSIYYEEDFVVFTDSAAAADGVGVWSAAGVSEDCVQQTNPSAEDRYGYDAAYLDSAGYSLGSARKVTVNSATGAADAAPKAEFTFTGTGFDIISLTNSASGTIVVTVEGENGFQSTGSVDTYYGYAYEGGEWTVSPSSDTLWQVPVIKMSGLSYGTYTVTIQTAYLESLDHAGNGAYSFWLDAVRIYDPAGEDERTAAIHAGDGEHSPSYVTVRDVLAAAGSLNAGDGRSPGAVFIDGVADTDNILTYVNAGPSHETYLAKGQGVAFRLLADRVPDALHLGVRLANGDSGTLKLGEEDLVNLTTATDLYYDLGSKLTWEQVGDRYESGVIFLSNPSEAILSLTNLKATGGARWDLSGVSALSLADEGSVFSLIPFTDKETKDAAVNTMTRLYPKDAPSFGDVPTEAWYSGAVDYVTAGGLMSGAGNAFLPEETVSRAQVVQTLFSMAGKPGFTAGTAFSDVDEDSWYGQAVSWAATEGFAAGSGDGAFAPEAEVTREQLALFLHAYSGAPQLHADLSAFADGNCVSGWAVDAVEWAVSRGLISGKSGGLLDPQGTATRGELAQILMNFHKS